MGDEPPGLHLRYGSAFGVGLVDRGLQIAELLTVHQPGDPSVPTTEGSTGGPYLSLYGSGQREYEEARIEPGDVVTVIGKALPFDQLADPTGADSASGSGLDADGGIADPEIAADLAEARAAGLLETDPEAAWGNAAIPGFGIGRPTRAPELDPAADTLPIATAAEAEQAERVFEIDPDELIVADAPDVDLLVSLGPPAAAVAREEARFLVGLLGAIVAIASAVLLATALSGGLTV